MDSGRIIRAQQASGKALKDFDRLQMCSGFPWCIASIPIPSWAKTVFPDAGEEAAMEQLWDAIFKAVRISGDGTAVEKWQEHLALLRERLLCEGSATVTVSSAEAIANIGRIDATGVTGMVTYNANDWYSRIPFGKMAGFDKIRKTYDGEWTPGDVSALAGYQLEITAGSMLVNSAMQAEK